MVISLNVAFAGLNVFFFLFDPIPTSNLCASSLNPGAQTKGTAAILSNQIISVKCIHLHAGSTAAVHTKIHSL